MKKEIFSGLGLGLLIGIIIGLSIAEVTGIILGALTSLLAAFFGLRSTLDGEKGNQLIIGTFSFSCVLSIFLGLFIRTHNLLAPSLTSQIKEYKLASFDSNEIKKIILLKEFGLVPEGSSFSKEAKQSTEKSVLMTSNNQELYLCNDIDSNSTLEEIKRAYVNSGSQYADFEIKLSNIITDKTELRNTLIYFKTLICDHQ
ncbi:MAG: hypothetical protein U0W24_19260 [Bacteroidales bacterium]